MGTNFATVQNVDFIIKVIKCLIPPLLRSHCEVGLTTGIWFTLKKLPIINFLIFEVIIAVRITNLVTGEISYEDKMRIQTFREIGFRYRTIDTNFPEKGRKRSSVKTICLPFFIL